MKHLLLTAIAAATLLGCASPADIQHPQRLANAGAWGAPAVFVRNSLCALTQANLKTALATPSQTTFAQYGFGAP
jgi:opacity protein-like surface antigen